MKSLFIGLFVGFAMGSISGCYSSTSAFIRLHEAVAKSDSKRACYRIDNPEHIAGRYCMTFREEAFKKDQYILVKED